MLFSFLSGQSQFRICWGGRGWLLHLGIGTEIELKLSDRKKDWHKEKWTEQESERAEEGKRGRSRWRNEHREQRKRDGGSQTALTFTPSRTTYNIQRIWLHLMWRDWNMCVCVCVCVCVYFYFWFTRRSVTISMSVHASLCVSLILFTCWCLLVRRHVDMCICVAVCVCARACKHSVYLNWTPFKCLITH